MKYMEQKNKNRRGNVINLVLLLLILLLGVGIFSKLSNLREKPEDNTSEGVAVTEIVLSSESIVF